MKVEKLTLEKKYHDAVEHWRRHNMKDYNLLMKNCRLVHLDTVIEAIDQMLNRRLGVVVAEVTSAQTLGEEQRSRLQAVLGRVLGQKIDLTVKTDPRLLGGFVARIGSYRYDASLDGQLGRLAGKLAQEN